MSSAPSPEELLDKLAESFAQRYRNGERPSLSEYTDRYPELATQIRELFPALVMMEDVEPEPAAADPVRSQGVVPALNQLGDFRIIREIGRGGMGIVYEAEQESLGRRVALKVLPQSLTVDAKYKKRFEREARAAAKLHHTNIVPVFGVGEHDGLQFYAMQFIHGLGLDEVLTELRTMKAQGDQAPALAFPVRESNGERTPAESEAALAATVARSLVSGQFEETVLYDAAQSDSFAQAPTRVQGHGADPAPLIEPLSATRETAVGRLSDTWSGSVALPGQSSTSAAGRGRSGRQAYWLSIARIGHQIADGLEYAHDQGILHRDIKPSNLLLDTRGTVWVTDFGLAKGRDQEDLTKTGDIVGTLRYMAPEMFSGRADPRSDVYSLGLTLYEMLAFKPAFDEPDRQKLIRQVLSDAPRRLRTLDATIPRDLETIVHKAIERDPAHRYQSAGELRDDLQRFLGDEPVKARRISIVSRFGRWCRRNPQIAWLTTTVAFLLITAAVVAGIAAINFRELAGRNSKLVGEKGNALTKAQDATTKAQDAETKANIARGEAEAQSKQLAANVDLALQALEQVYLQFAEQRLASDGGMDDKDRQFLEKALPFYEAFAKQKENDPSTKRSVALAAKRIGIIARQLGEHQRSLEALERSIALWQEQLVADRQSFSVRHDLADTRLHLGWTLNSLGSRGQAESVFAQVVTEAEQLVSDDPQEALYQRLRALSRREQAIAMIGQGKSEAGEQLLRTSVEEFEAILAKQPENAQHRHDLAYALNMLGNLQRDTQRTSDAEQTYADFLQKYEAVTVSQPDRTDVLAGLANSQREYAWMFRNSGRQSEAEKAFRRAAEQYRKLAEKSPHDPEVRHLQALTLMPLGTLLKDQRRHEDALLFLREADDIGKTLTQWWPKNEAYRWGHAETLIELGQVLHGTGKPDDAEGALRQGIAEYSGVPPTRGHEQNMLGHGHRELTRIATERKDFAAADRHQRDAIEHWQTAIKAVPDKDWYYWPLKEFLLAQTEALTKQGRYTEAEAACRLALPIAEEIVRRFGKHDDQAGATKARWMMAGFAADAGRKDEAARLAGSVLDGIKDAAVDYKVQITTPGRYRLLVRGAGHTPGADSAYVRIVELCDGPFGRQPDWYFFGLPNPYGFDFSDFAEIPVNKSVFQMEARGGDGIPAEPSIWWIDEPGVYTVRFLMREDGFALDRFTLQLASRPISETGGTPEAGRNKEGVFVETDGSVTVEGEHFFARTKGSHGHQWLIVPDEDRGAGRWRNPSGGKHLQVLPAQYVLHSFANFPYSSDRTLDKSAKILARLTELCELEPNNADWFMARAAVNRSESNFDAAIADTARVLALRPEDKLDRDFWLERGMARWELNQFKEALADFDEYLKRPATSPHQLRRDVIWDIDRIALALLKSEVHTNADRFLHVAALYEKAQAVDQNAYMWINQGIAYYRAERYPEALSRFLAGLPILGDDSFTDYADRTAGLMGRVALTHYRVGDHAAARTWHALTADWRRAHGVKNGEWHKVLREDMEAFLGPLEKAGNPDWKPEENLIDLYTRLLELAPETPWAYNLRARVHRTAGRLADAKADEERALAAYDRLIDRNQARVQSGWYWLHVMRGRFLYRDLKRYAAARHDYSRAIEIEPEALQAWNERGICHSRLGQESDALSDYTQAVKLSRYNPILLGNRASTLQRLQRYDEAAADYHSVLDEDGGNERAWSELPKSLMSARRYFEAAGVYTIILLSHPTDVVTINLRGIANYRAERWHDALTDFSRCLELQPDGQLYLSNRISTLLQLGNEDEALDEYGRLIALNPEYLFDGSPERSLMLNTRYIQRVPSNPHAWEARGLLLNHRYADERAALVDLEEAIRLNPQSGRPRLSRGRIHIAAKRLEDAAGDLLEALRLGEANSNELTELIGALMEVDDRTKAIQVLNQAVSHQSAGYRPYYELGLLQLAAGNREAHQAVCRQMLDRFATGSDLLTERFTVWTAALGPESAGDWAPILKIARHAVEKDASIRDQLGAALYRAGRYAEAAAELEKAARPVDDEPFTPQNSAAAYACYFLALAQGRLGNAAEAARWLEHATAWTEKELNPPVPPRADNKPSAPRAVVWNRRETLKLLRAEAESEITNNARLWITSGRAHVERGEHDQADADFNKAATLTSDELDRFLQAGWWVIGPYPAGIRELCPPEVDPDPSKPLHIIDPGTGLSDEPVAWKTVTPDALHWLDVKAALAGTGEGSAYLLNYVYSPDERTVMLRIGFETNARVWLNGELLFESEQGGIYLFHDRRVPLTLKPGRNVLLVKTNIPSRPDKLRIGLGDRPVHRAYALMEAGRWREAADLFRNEAGPELRERPHSWCWFALVLYATGDTVGYHRECHAIFEKHGASTQPQVATWVCITLLSAPNPVFEGQSAAIERHLNQTITGHPLKEWSSYLQSLYFLRKGDLATARRHADGVPNELSRLPLQGLVAQRATDAKAAAARLAEAQSPNYNALYSFDGFHRSRWPVVLINVLLLREAEVAHTGRTETWDEQFEKIQAAAREWSANLDPTTAAFDHLVRTDAMAISHSNAGYSHLARARRFVQLRRWDEAEADFNRAVELNPQDTDLLAARGTFYADRGDADKAAADFHAGLRLFGDNSDTTRPLWLWGQPLMLEAARRDDVFEKFLALQPRVTEIWNARFITLARQGRLAEGSPDLDRIPKQGWHSIRATAFLLAGDRESYEAVCRQFPDERRNTPMAIEALAVGPASDVEPTELLRIAQELYDGSNGAVWRRMHLGLAQVRSGRYEDALKSLEPFGPVGATPFTWNRAPEAWALMAIAHYHRGDLNEARRWLSKAKLYVDLYERAGFQPRYFGRVNGQILHWARVAILCREAQTLLDGPVKPSRTTAPPEDSRSK